MYGSLCNMGNYTPVMHAPVRMSLNCTACNRHHHHPIQVSTYSSRLMEPKQRLHLDLHIYNLLHSCRLFVRSPGCTSLCCIFPVGLVEGQTQTRLRCWALAQMGHMLGSGAHERSHVVGVGKNPPQYIQHRASSCPGAGNASSATPPCNWLSGFYPPKPNPGLDLIRGALVAGPDNKDRLSEVRGAEDMRVAVHWNAGFMATLAALSATDTGVRSCESFHGVFQRYVTAPGNTL